MSSTQSGNALADGTVIHHYIVESVLGEGSFGIVYKVRHTTFRSVFAIKEFLPKDLAHRLGGSTVTPISPDQQDTYAWLRHKFINEARMLWELHQPERHPNIVRVSDFFEDKDTAYMVMDFEAGKPLDAVLRARGTLPEDELMAIVLPLLDGLEKVHAKAVWHRDIKPGNILIRDADGSPVLIDFGAARWEAMESEQSKFALLTPEYAAPEQGYVGGKIGPWTDIYSLAATLYRATSGQLPRILDEDFQPAVNAADASQHYSKALLEAVDVALQLKPENRPQSVAEWRAHFPQQAAVVDNGEPPAPGNASAETVVHPVAQPAPARTRRRLAPKLAMLVVVAVVVAVAVGLLARWYPPAPPPAADTASEAPQPTPAGPVITTPTSPGSTSNGELSRVQDEDRKSLVAAIERLLDALPCKGLRLASLEGERLNLAGFTTAEALASLRAQMGVIEGARLGVGIDAVRVVPAPLCPPLAMLARQANLALEPSPALRIALNQSADDYREGDMLSLTVAPAAPYDGYLYVDLIDPEGTIVHLTPSPQYPNNQLRSGETLELGSAGEYEIGAPHGRNLIVSIFVRQPLFTEKREMQEKLETYLPALTGALADTDRRDIISTHLFITTAPR